MSARTLANWIGIEFHSNFTNLTVGFGISGRRSALKSPPYQFPSGNLSANSFGDFTEMGIMWWSKGLLSSIPYGAT